ncbi:tyrosine-type recombinase/integrase [Clostridium sp. BJN0001]|uniref:tyrosine-type recombinase/integrase n=1 Tax=Clostridium sp. BJN0001 TaxID=2930219 RepID=UPI001FD12AA5|nr:tyrosine-type recombinase/integrase [Clostridium sp. BJN0001]
MEGGVRKKGNRWYYYFEAAKINGKRKKIERAGGKTQKEALKKLREALNEYSDTGSLKKDSNLSVQDYYEYWFKEYVVVNCKMNTQRNYKMLINTHILPNIGIYKLKDITSTVLQELINKKYLDGYSKNYLSNLYGVLSGSFKAAVQPYKLIKENPMLYVSLPKYNKKLINSKDDLKIITIEEYNTILKRFPYGSNMHIPLQIAFYTGMRAAEVMSLTWDCIDFKNKSIKVEKILFRNNFNAWEFGPPKTKSSIRTILIGDTLIELLKKFKHDQENNKERYKQYYVSHKYDFVCLKEDGELLTTDSLKYLSRVVNYELGIKFKFHSLRHTHATLLLESGANIKDIQVRLGHSKLATTMDTYSHVTKKMKNDTVNIFENIIKKTSTV